MPHLSNLCCSVLGLPGPQLCWCYFSFDVETFAFLFSVTFQTTENRGNQVSQ